MEKSIEAQQSVFVHILPDLSEPDSTGRIVEGEAQARNLAKLAWDPARQTPFVVACGERVRGNTSLLQQTRVQLEGSQPLTDTRKVHTLRFNAWSFPHDDSVLIGLLGTLLSEFRQGHLLEQLRFQVDNKLAEPACLLLHAAAPWAFAGPTGQVPRQIHHSVVDQRRVYSELFRDLFLQAAYLLFQGRVLWDSAAAVPQTLWDEQTRGKFNLAIFLEDLEQCQQDRKLELVETISLLLDLPIVSFYLDADREWLMDLLSSQRAGIKETFLEKLLQVDGPPPSRRPAREVISLEQAQPRKSPEEAIFREIEWVWIPAGSFSMGSLNGRYNEQPVHAVDLSGFRIARYPVTNAQYARYVSATQVRPPPHWRQGRIPQGRENHPVVFVSWREALGYCDWLSETLPEQGRVRLPSEAQWEYAARGSKGREYPWGNEAPDRALCNFNNYVNDTTPVGAYPKGASPEGVHDLVGNVWEWTCSKWERYPYATTERKRNKREAITGDEHRVLRGCSFRYGAWYVRSACRGNSHPDGRHSRVGFRVVMTTG